MSMDRGQGRLGGGLPKPCIPAEAGSLLQSPDGGVHPSPTASPHTALLTCEAEAQHSQGGGHTHTCARAAHLPLRQLTAGVSAANGCPACEERK